VTEQQPPQPKSYFDAVLLPSVFMLFVTVFAGAVFKIDSALYDFLQKPGNQISPLGDSPAGQAGFSFIYLGISIVLVFGLTAVVKRHKIKEDMFYFISVMFLISSLLLALETFYYMNRALVLEITYALWVTYIYAASGKIPHVLVLPFIAAFASLAGIVVAMSLPLVTVLLMPVIFACWDIYAVFRGPMTKLAVALLQTQRLKYLFVVKVGAVSIGLGDLMFYSMLASASVVFGTAAASQTQGAMLGGFVVTMLLLRNGKHRALPALPIPIFMGMAGLGLALAGV
jgi:hypothetical protein